MKCYVLLSCLLVSISFKYFYFYRQVKINFIKNVYHISNNNNFLLFLIVLLLVNNNTTHTHTHAHAHMHMHTHTHTMLFCEILLQFKITLYILIYSNYRMYFSDSALNFQHHYSSLQCHMIFRNHYNIQILLWVLKLLCCFILFFGTRDTFFFDEYKVKKISIC